MNLHPALSTGSRPGMVFQAALRVFRAIPFKEVILVALLLQGFKEFFPFSHFPMYSTLPPDTDYFYLTDGDGNLIGQQSIFGVRAARMKKIFQANQREIMAGGEVGREEASRLAGERTLDYLYEVLPSWNRDQMAGVDVLLRRVEVVRRPDGLHETDELVATRRSPALPGSP
jgi:hypothetical protein